MRRAAALAVLSLATASFPAAPPIATIDVARSGDDLVISWLPPATPVDGYRIYASGNVDCSASSVIYDGTAPTYTVASGLAQDLSVAIYRIVTYLGSQEGPPAGPVYKYEVFLPGMVWPTGDDEVAVSLPRNSSLAFARDLCIDANGAIGRDRPLYGAAHWNPDTSTSTTLHCVTTVRGRPIVWPESLALRPRTSNFFSIVIWGHGHGDETISLPIARRLIGTRPTAINLYRISLPYDHDYDNLAAVAADVPYAVDVRIWTGDSTNGFYGEGLTRASSADPWSGTNYSLTNRRGEGLLVAVEAPTTWVPRRLCIGPTRIKPFAIRDLKAVRNADDVDLSWTPDGLALGGYSVYRVRNDKTAIPSVLAGTPQLMVPAPSPVFPVVDPGAVPPPDLFFYQVVGRAGDGSPGEL